MSPTDSLSSVHHTTFQPPEGIMACENSLELAYAPRFLTTDGRICMIKNTFNGGDDGRCDMVDKPFKPRSFDVKASLSICSSTVSISVFGGLYKCIFVLGVCAAHFTGAAIVQLESECCARKQKIPPQPLWRAYERRGALTHHPDGNEIFTRKSYPRAISGVLNVGGR